MLLTRGQGLVRPVSRRCSLLLGNRPELGIQLRQVGTSAAILASRSSSSARAVDATRDTLRPAALARLRTSSGTVIFTRDMRIIYTPSTNDISATRNERP